MRIIRGNTLPDYSLLSQNASGFNIDGYQHHEKWQYQPVMGVNVDEVDGAAVEALSPADVERFKATRRGVAIEPSKFNVSKAFPDGTTAIFNMMTESIALLTQEELAEVKTRAVDEEFGLVALKLYELGFLTRADDDEDFKLQVIRARSAFASSDAINFIIYPTMGCNARCAYCFEEGVPQTSMSNETVGDTIDFILRNVAPGDEVVFRWFGGEPLIAHKAITHICTEVGNAWGDAVVFNSNITTNGFAINDGLIETAVNVWHAKKFHLTIDGWRDEHGRRKKYLDQSVDSYGKLLSDIDKLMDAGIFVVCRLNLDKNNLHMLDQILTDLERFKDSKLFYIHSTTLRCPVNGNPDDYILQSDFPWAYDQMFRAMYEHGFYHDIKHILPLRLRGNCLARVMNEVIIGADGLLYKCEQYPTLPQYSVGSLKTGIVFNDVYRTWINPDIEREQCRKCSFLPLCGGGCKQYWDANRPGIISPCVREKAHFDVVAQLVYEWGTRGSVLPREE